MHEGEVVRISYSIRTKGSEFSETKSLVTVVGSNLLIKGLEEELRKMEVGEEKFIEIPPEKGFGKRDESKISTFLLSELGEVKVGDRIKIFGLEGKVLSVNGGRVKIDFNHPLAGKTLECKVKIEEKIEDLQKKVEEILSTLTGLKKEEFKVFAQGDCAEIEIEGNKEVNREVLANFLKRWIGIRKIKFSYWL